MNDKKLSDNEVYDLMFEAQQVLGKSQANTVRGQTALKAARTTLNILQIALVKAGEDAEDKLRCIIEDDLKP